MRRQPPRSRLKITTTVLMMLAALVTSSGVAAAHNPACHHTAVANTGTDAPHYDGTGGDQTSSQTTFEQNPTLDGDYSGKLPVAALSATRSTATD